jgi:drug/metabolite transporter (DMT)-like permease
MNKERLGLIEILFASFLFGFLPIMVKLGNNLGAYNLSFYRILISAISLLPLFLLFKKFKLIPFKYEKGKLVLFGAIHGFIILGYFLAIEYLSIASAVILLYSSSIWIVLFSNLILKEKITNRTIFALIVSFIGLILILSPTNFFLKESLFGSIAGLLAGIGFGLVYVLSKTFKKYDKVSLTFWQNLIAIPFVIPLLFINPILTFSTKDIWIILLIGVVFTTLPFILVYKGFEKVKAQKGGVIILLDIIFPILLAFIIFSEFPTVIETVGGLLIILGSFIVFNQK